METFPLEPTVIQVKSIFENQSVLFITVNDKKYYLRKDKCAPCSVNKLLSIKPTQGAFVGDDLIVFSNDKIVGTFKQVQAEPNELGDEYADIGVSDIYIDGEVPYRVIKLIFQGSIYFSKSNLYINGNNEPTLFDGSKKFTLAGFDHSDAITATLEDGGTIDFQYIREEETKLELLIAENLANLDITDLNERGFFEPDFERRDESYGSYFLNECINMAPNDAVRDELLAIIKS
jgi:hypothetical protein